MISIKTLSLRALPWLASFIVVSLLLLIMLSMEGHDLHKEESVTLRKIDLLLPPPPEPPPPLQTEAPESDSVTPTIDLIGPGQGLTLNYSDNPKLTTLSLERVDKPEFDTDSLDFNRTLSVDFPILKVEQLDQVPRLVSSNRISFPKELRKRGITQIATKVEIIIDQNGKAFVKKIVDPVYPEMMDIIRKAINDSRFTVPTKNGKPVQAAYLYTLKFIYRT